MPDSNGRGVAQAHSRLAKGLIRHHSISKLKSPRREAPPLQTHAAMLACLSLRSLHSLVGCRSRGVLDTRTASHENHARCHIQCMDTCVVPRERQHSSPAGQLAARVHDRWQQQMQDRWQQQTCRRVISARAISMRRCALSGSQLNVMATSPLLYPLELPGASAPNDGATLTVYTCTHTLMKQGFLPLRPEFA